jgi:hypothetical protein
MFGQGQGSLHIHDIRHGLLRLHLMSALPRRLCRLPSPVVLGLVRLHLIV